MCIITADWLTFEEYASHIAMDATKLQHILIQKNKGFKFKKFYCSNCGYCTDVRTSICDRCQSSMRDE